LPHIFEGAPDARQSKQTTFQTSRFRPRYCALTDEEKALHDQLKDKAAELEALFEKTATLRASAPDAPNSSSGGRYKSLALTALEQSLMRIVKELTA
jgi:hypothetical protein